MVENHINAGNYGPNNHISAGSKGAVDIYDTPIPNDRLYEYVQWLKESQGGRDQRDYDTQGLFMDGGRLGEGHSTDRFKKPNHPTFSTESQYHNTPANSILGKLIRDANPSEMDFFQTRPEVGGYAAEDGNVVLNPLSSLSPEEQQGVAQNEAVRLWLRGMPNKPTFNLSAEQEASPIGSYSKNPRDVMDTMMGRIATGDPSAGSVTPAQRNATVGVMDYIKQNKTQPMNIGGTWDGNTFHPSDFNYQNMSLPQLQQYFWKGDPDARIAPEGILAQIIKEMGY